MIKFTKKTINEIGYIIEAVKYLLEINYESEKLKSFIFKMLESKIKHFVLIGIEMAQKYKKYTDIAIDKCIAEGLDNEDIFRFFIEMINRDNFESIIKKRGNIILDLEGREVKPENIQNIVNEIMNKVFLYVDSKVAMDYFLIDPLFSQQKRVENYLTPSDKTRLYEIIKSKKNTEFFCLIQQICPIPIEARQELIKEHFLHLKNSLRVEKHFHNFDTFKFLLEQLIKTKDYKNSRDLLISIFEELQNVDLVKNLLIENILLYNLFLSEKLAYFGTNVFVEFRFLENDGKIYLLINHPSFINVVKGFNGLDELSCTNVSYSGNSTCTTFDTNNGTKIRVDMNYKFKWYENILEMATRAKY